MRTGADVESLASSLAITLSNWAFSLTVCENVPIWSSELPKAMRPETRNRSVSWLKANNPVKGSRLADRATCI